MYSLAIIIDNCQWDCEIEYISTLETSYMYMLSYSARPHLHLSPKQY